MNCSTKPDDRVMVRGGGYRLMMEEYESHLPSELWFRVVGVGPETLTVASPGSLATYKVLKEQCRQFVECPSCGPYRYCGSCEGNYKW